MKDPAHEVWCMLETLRLASLRLEKRRVRTLHLETVTHLPIDQGE